MSSLPMEVIEVVGQTMAKVVPVTIALALVFTVLSHFWSCTGQTRRRKRELMTDICYWFFVPVFARIFRIGLLVIGASVLFNIHEVDDLIAFYDNGHGPLSELPLWAQAILFLVASDFMLYWLHRMCSAAADSGNTMRSIIPRKIWSGSRRRDFTPSTCSSERSWSTSSC